MNTITPEQARQELRRREAAAELQRRGVTLNTGGQRKPDIVDKVFGPVTDGAVAMEQIHRDLDTRYGTPSHPIGGVARQRRSSNEVTPDDTIRLTRAMGPVGGTAFALSSALQKPAPVPKPETFTPDPLKQYFMPVPKRKFFENFLPTQTPGLPPWEEATTREKAEKILKPATGIVANTLWRALAFAARPAYAAYKRARPQDIPEEMKDMTLDEAVAHLSGRDPSGLEKLMGGVMEFVGPTKLAGSVLGKIGGQAPKAVGLLGGAIKTAETWGAGEVVNQLGKRMAQEIDPSEANYNYEGMIAVVKTAATALPIGAIGTTELAPIVKTALEATVFGSLTAAEGGTPEEIVTAFAIPLGLKGKAGLRWRREIAAEAVGRVRDEIITRNKGDEATIKDVTAKADKTIEDIKAGKLDIREPDEVAPAPGKPEYLKSEWTMKREFAPGEQVEPLQEAYRSLLVNKHIALYQAFEASEPGSVRWKELQSKIYAMTKAINDVDGIADPAEGRQFVPIEYARAKATPKQIFRVRGELGYPAGPTVRPEAPVVGETPAKRVIRKIKAAPVTTQAQVAPQGPVAVEVAPVVAEAKPKTRRGLELSILKTADKAGLTTDQYRDALEKAVGKRSIKDLSPDELNTAAAYFQQTYKAAPTEKDVLVVVDEQTVKMGDVINEAVQSVANLKPQKRVLRKQVPIGSARGIRAGLRKAGRFFFGEFNAGPYYLAKVLDGGNEKGIFSRIFDRNIQIGNSLRSQNIFTLNDLSQQTRKAAGTTADDLAVMSRAVNPRFKTQERIRAWRKTKVIPIEIGGRKWDFTMGRLLNFYGQTSQVDPTTNKPIGREYARRFGIRLENQFTGPMSDAEIDALRSMVESDPKAMAEMDIEWRVVGPTRAKFVNETSQRVEGRDIATIPNWYHLEISKSYRVPGKTIRVETGDTETQSLESLIEEGASNLKIDLIENQSIFEARRGGGRGPLVVRDHFEVVNAVNHATAAYYGFAQPFRIARTVLNDPDIQGGLDAKGYRDTRELLTKLFSRLQGSERGAGGELGPFKKMRAGFYRAVINFSPQVILPQPTSVLNYGAYADAKYVAVAVGGMFNPTTSTVTDLL